MAEEIIESTVKRLALLKESVPSLHCIGILANPGNYGTAAYMRGCEDWARGEGVMLRGYDVKNPSDFPPAFDRMVVDKVKGVLAFTDSVIFRQRELIVKTALKYKLSRRLSIPRMGRSRWPLVLWPQFEPDAAPANTAND